MNQLHDAEVAKRLLFHLARAFGCPDAVYLAGPVRIQGGLTPRSLASHLIIQLQRNRTGPQIDTSTDILMIPWKKMPAKTAARDHSSGTSLIVPHGPTTDRRPRRAIQAGNNEQARPLRRQMGRAGLEPSWTC